jgi:hypothetical protein
MLRAMQSSAWRRVATPLAIFVVCSSVYVATLGPRITGPSDNNHFVHLAQSLLHGQLALLSPRPPGNNDWAYYDGRWYVSFPPFPALVIAPLVAIWGTEVWDRLFWALLAGLTPALLYTWLRRLRAIAASDRTARENLLLTALFAFGSPYYYTSVQGTVWFAAHVVTCALIAIFLLSATQPLRPLLAGCALGLAFMSRGPSLLPFSLFFAVQALIAARRPGSLAPSRIGDLFVDLELRKLLGMAFWFALPLLSVLAIAMWMNSARFDDPFEFGHSHLRIRWSQRIETWGLFNYHYLGRNLGVFLASLPWLSTSFPYIQISRHGLAVWVTTPHLLMVLWPKRHSLWMTALALSAAAVAVCDLLYQNSGWVQFGYRFSLDYSLALFGLLALGGRRFGKLFHALALYAFAINLFGAITFDRDGRFYDNDPTQRVIFQPD